VILEAASSFAFENIFIYNCINSSSKHTIQSQNKTNLVSNHTSYSMMCSEIYACFYVYLCMFLCLTLLVLIVLGADLVMLDDIAISAFNEDSFLIKKNFGWQWAHYVN
jgi:hypothetical protein